MNTPVDIKNLHNVSGSFMLMLKDGHTLGPIVAASFETRGMPLVVVYKLILASGDRKRIDISEIASGWTI